MRAQLCTSLVSAAFLLAAPSPGQTTKPASKAIKTWTPPRTADGQPDLQGYWTNATFTPLERPAELANKEFYTEAEAAAFEKERILRENSQAANDIHYDNVIWQSENYPKGAASRRTSLIFDPPDGRIPPLSAEGQKRAVLKAQAERRREAAESADSRNLAERCIAWGAEGPPMLGSTYNANLQIVQSGTHAVIYNEMMHGGRIVPLDGTPHLPAAIRQLGGDSRGHWEGGTLVVDSANFTDETNFRGPPATARRDIFSSSSLHVVERFTRIEPGAILYRFTVEDPGTWTKPWTGEIVMRKIEGPIYEYACHEGNYGLANILAGARAAEQAAKKGGK